MVLIRKLPAEKDAKGNWQSYGEFLCPNPICNKIVKRLLGNGLRDKSCGCRKNEFSTKKRKGQKRTKEQRQNISKSLKGKPQTQETIEKRRKANIGKKRTEEQRQNISKSLKGKKRKPLTEEQRQNLSNILKGSRLGKENPMFSKQVSKETRDKISLANKGKKLSEEHKQKIKENHADFSGEKAPNWQNGKSFEEYPIEFKQIKKFILERDNYECQDSNCDGNHKKLHTHHIDYDKKNNNPENLIVLCSSCHSKTSGKNKRKYFTEFYQTIIMGKVMECLL